MKVYVDPVKQKETPSLLSYDAIRAHKKQSPLKGWRKSLAWFQVTSGSLLYGLRTYKSLGKTFRAYQSLKAINSKSSGEKANTKIVQIGNSFYWRLYMPGWNTPYYFPYIKAFLNKVSPIDQPTHRLNNAFLAITTKCPLKCEHCYEWERLNQPEKMSIQDVEKLVDQLQSIGTTTIEITGGEPMLRIKDMLPAIEKGRDKSAFWILTSGFSFSEEHAISMKAAGLTGVMVSIDHYDPEKHDQFRGREGTFRQALYAIKYSIENDLVAGITVCLTRETANQEFMEKYMEFAKDLGVTFVQFIEPKAVGHYKGKDIFLRKAQIDLIEGFYQKMNTDSKYQDYPIIIYQEFYQRRVGCVSGGKMSIYIDSNGNIQSCPFCHVYAGNALEDDLLEVIDRMASQGCGLLKALREAQ